MSVRNKQAIDRYVQHHAQLTQALQRLQAFVDRMPAPDDAECLPGVDYDYTGTVEHLAGLLTEAAEITKKNFN